MGVPCEQDLDEIRAQLLRQLRGVIPLPELLLVSARARSVWNSPARQLPNARAKEGGGWGPEGRGSEADVEIILSRRSSGVLMLLLRSCMRRRVAC